MKKRNVSVMLALLVSASALGAQPLVRVETPGVHNWLYWNREI